MSTSDIITISVTACACIITLLLLVGTVHGVNVKEKSHRCFFAMLLFNLAGSVCELSIPLFMGMPGQAVSCLLRVLDFLDYTFGCMLYGAFILYLYELFLTKGPLSKKPFLIISGIYALNIPLIALSHAGQFFAYLDENNIYHAQDGYWAIMIFPAISTVLAVIQILRHAKAPDFERKERITLLIYLMVPFVCFAVEVWFPDVWISYMGTTTTLLLVYINIQVTLSHRMKAQETQMIESRVAVMLSQIKPHFLINSLLAVHDLNKRDHAAANDAILVFSEYLRGNMDALNLKRNIPFEDELRHVQTYLSLEKLRFEDTLRVVFDISVHAFFIPALTLQPIVENAVRHGVMKREEGGTVTVSTHETESAFVITVADDGVGFDPAQVRRDERRHMGIENTRSRLAILCDGSLGIVSAPGAGTTAVVILPKGGHTP